MSPEQVKGTSEVDFRTDLWAIGVIAYQCVVGQLPFDSEGVGDLLIKISIADPPVPSKVFPGVSPLFDAWFAKACDRDRNKRFQSARELAEALARVVQSVPEAMRGAPPPRPTSVRPPIAPGPTSVRGTKPGLNPSPQAPPPPVSRPPALPTTPQPAVVAARVVEPAPGPIVEQEIDDFDFDFDEDAPGGSAAAAPAVLVSTPVTAPGPNVAGPSVSPAPAARPSAPVATPLPQAPAPALPQATPLPESTNIVASQGRVSNTSLGAPVYQPDMLVPAPVAAPHPTVSASAVSPTTAPGIASGDRISPPPELDGSRKKKTLGFVVLLFVLILGGVAFFVVQSNMLPPEPIAAPSASAVSMPEPPPVVVIESPSATFATTPATTKVPATKYTGKPFGTNKSKTTKPGPSSTAAPKPTDKPGGDIVIEVPTPPGDDDSVPPAP
jgi:hypothetical protein